MELFPEDRYCGTHSLYEIGKIYQSLQMPELAKQSYELITCKETDCPFDYSSVSPIAQFAEIGRISIETQTKIENTTVRSSQHDILKNGVSQLAKITNEASVLVKSKSNKKALKKPVAPVKNIVFGGAGFSDPCFSNWNPKPHQLLNLFQSCYLY